MNDGNHRCPRGHVARLVTADGYPPGWVVPRCPSCTDRPAGLPFRPHPREPKAAKEPSQRRLSVLFSLLAICVLWNPS